MAASAPPAASGGAYSLGAVDYSNLTPRKGPSSSSASAATSSALYDDFPSNSAASTTATTATPAVVTQTAVAPTHVQIEKTAANASIGEAGTEAESQTYMAKAAQYGGSAMAALGAIVGGAAVVVEKATGVDLTHSHEPVSPLRPLRDAWLS